MKIYLKVKKDNAYGVTSLGASSSKSKFWKLSKK